ncbi:MAG: AAA family ATPase [Acidipropionibacterium sp.]|nr:AAA family ATPase [Acidipropionibacterium sp.]
MPSTSGTKRPRLKSIAARGFRSLEKVNVEFGPFTVLVGPNGSGKSNLLEVLRFVRDSAQLDLDQAIEGHGGFDSLRRATSDTTQTSLTIEALVTEHSSPKAIDKYTLTLKKRKDHLIRRETFTYKRTGGPGRRFGFKVDGDVATVGNVTGSGGKTAPGPTTEVRLTGERTSALSAFSRISNDELQSVPREFTDFLAGIKYLDPNVEEARLPARRVNDHLGDDASNLAAVLLRIRNESPEAFADLQRDLARCLPGLQGIEVAAVGGASRDLVAELIEAGLERPIELADASFGTVRMLSLLAALHDPNPPALMIVEEVDHGLHPYALDVLAERMREASARTQIIAASHSPTFVNNLRPDEVVLCDRDLRTGASTIPSATRDEIRGAVERSGMGIGELWYSGVIGGVPSDE